MKTVRTSATKMSGAGGRSRRATGSGRVIGAYKGVALLLLNTLILLACLELVAIGISKIWGVPSSSYNAGPASPRENVSYYKSQKWAAQYWREHALTARVRYNPYEVWRRKAPFSGTNINIDENGLRITPGADCRAGSYKVFVFGGSTIWGTGSPDWGTIPAYLQSGLEALRGGAVCVMNFGETGFVSTQEVIKLLMELERGNIPNVVIFYDGANDVSSAYQSGRAGVHLNLSDIAARFDRHEEHRFSFVEWLTEHSLLFALVNRLVADLLPDAHTKRKLITYETMGIGATKLSRSLAQVYLTNYKMVKGLAQEYGFKYFFFWQPVISRGNKALTSEEADIKSRLDSSLVKLINTIYPAIEQAASGSEYSNLFYIARVFDTDTSQIWIDAFHVTPVGNREVAHKILAVITASQPGQKKAVE